jgi:hypothetical protein
MQNRRVSRAITIVLPGKVLVIITMKRLILYIDPYFNYIDAYKYKGSLIAY